LEIEKDLESMMKNNETLSSIRNTDSQLNRHVKNNGKNKFNRINSNNMTEKRKVNIYEEIKKLNFQY
jgi:hypothetical protein